MSAWLVDDSTINCIVNYLAPEHRGYFSGIFGSLKIDQTDLEHLEFLGACMHGMNLLSVQERYQARAVEHFDMKSPYGFVMEKTTAMQTLKHLQCFLYQCNEGKLDETPLFRGLEKAYHILAEIIISGTPEYQAAKWA